MSRGGKGGWSPLLFASPHLESLQALVPAQCSVVGVGVAGGGGGYRYIMEQAVRYKRNKQRRVCSKTHVQQDAPAAVAVVYPLEHPNEGVLREGGREGGREQGEYTSQLTIHTLYLTFAREQVSSSDMPADCSPLR
jgi:hypothetical protein